MNKDLSEYNRLLNKLVADIDRLASKLVNDVGFLVDDFRKFLEQELKDVKE